MTRLSWSPSRPRASSGPRHPRTDRARSSRARWTLWGVVIAAIMLTGVVSCTDRGGTNTASQQGSVALGHVPGLGVDPGTGDLYAASHYGLFRFPQSGQPARVGPVQDVMGFTVVGPNHFLASGHPGPDQDGPSNVGLLESTDGGRSWQTLSLAGQADFHALTTSHGVIYGSNAG